MLLVQTSEWNVEKMKIVNARTIVTSPGRNFVTVKLEKDEGVYGIGDATLNGRELAARYLYKRAYLPVNRLTDGTLTNCWRVPESA